MTKQVIDRTESPATDSTSEQEYPRFTYEPAKDFLDPRPAGCPFCKTTLVFADPSSLLPEEERDVYCHHDDCPYHKNPIMRQVYGALRANGWLIEDAAAMCLENVEQEPERFVVKDLKTADWVLKKIAGFQANIAAVDSIAADEHAEIDRRAEDAKKRDELSLNFFLVSFADQLREFALADRDTWGGKSKKLIHGEMGFRASSGRTVIDDEDQALALAKMRDSELLEPCLVKVTESVVPSEVKKELEDPELAPLWEGIAHIEGAGDKFSFKAYLPEKNNG